MPGSTVCCSIDHCYLDLGLKRPTEGLSEAIRYARLSCSKQLPNDVIFIWFTDKKRFLCTRMISVNLSQSLSKLDYTCLILVDPRVKINEISYCGLLLLQQLLPAVRSPANSETQIVLVF